MDSSLQLIDTLRKTSVSRRGGVRVRGGRLPPIRIRNVPQLSAPKKVVVPNIPQRRVKKEIPESTELPVIKREQRKDSAIGDNRGRGRGRGSRIYIQTDGTFLGEGPAAKVKKEPLDSYERISIPRRSKKEEIGFKTERDIKENGASINDLLNSYDENESFEDCLGIQPVRLPLLKAECRVEIKDECKTEIKEECKIETKEEKLELEDIKLEIKTDQTDLKLTPSEVKFSNFKNTKLNEKKYVNSFIEDIKDLKDENRMILLQLPSCLPFEKDDTPEQKDGKPKSGVQERDGDNKAETPNSFVHAMPEGFAGKLQILTSGRMRLVLGSISFELEDGSESESVREAISIRTEGNGGEMVVLGRVARKMIARPLLRQTLENLKTEQLN